MNKDLYKGIHTLAKDIKTDPSLENSLDIRFSVDMQTSIDGDVSVIDEVDLITNGRNRRVLFYLYLIE